MQNFNTDKGHGTAREINHRQALGYSETFRHSYPGSFIRFTGGVLFLDYEPPNFACRIFISVELRKIALLGGF